LTVVDVADGGLSPSAEEEKTLSRVICRAFIYKCISYCTQNQSNLLIRYMQSLLKAIHYCMRQGQMSGFITRKLKYLTQ